MAVIKRFDQKAANNRARVKKHRHFKKMKSIHETYIRDQIYPKEDVSVYGMVDLALNNSSTETDIASDTAERLRYWTVQHRITKKALNDLLVILILAGLTYLPKDGRTLMGTPKNVPIRVLTKGKLWYNGLKNCLNRTLAHISQKMTITLNFNFDGLPIAKSSNMQFWPILSNIRGMCIVRFQITGPISFNL